MTLCHVDLFHISRGQRESQVYGRLVHIDMLQASQHLLDDARALFHAPFVEQGYGLLHLRTVLSFCQVYDMAEVMNGFGYVVCLNGGQRHPVVKNNFTRSRGGGHMGVAFS